MCPFTPRAKWEKKFHHCCFESLRRKGKELGRSKREIRGKISKASGKNQTLVRWKEEEKVPLVLLKEIRAHLVREVKKFEKKVGGNFWKREKLGWFFREIQLARGRITKKITKESRCLRREQEAREKVVATGGRHKSGKEMKEDTVITTMKKSN